MTACKHYVQIMEYAIDAMNHEKPWELWESSSDNIKWYKWNHHITWDSFEFHRRKQKYININGFEVPEPLRVEPEVGTVYYVPNVLFGDVVSHKWNETGFHNSMLSAGLAHATKENASIHCEALLSFTKSDA